MKILWNLHYNARLPVTTLAKKVGISKQGASYRLHRLIEEEIIKGFVSVVDIHHLGYLTYRLYLRFQNVTEQKEKEILSYLKKQDHVLWLVTLSGPWDLEVVCTARNFIHFNNLWKSIKEDIGPHFSKYNLSMSIVNYHLNRDYLIDKQHQQFLSNYYGFEPKQEVLDALDKKLLTILSKNCRQSNQELGKQLKVSYHTIQQRIKKLEERKIIQSHRLIIDLSKLNRFHYKIALFLNNLTKKQEQELYSFCSTFNFIVYIIEVLGEWQLEIEAETNSEQEFLHFVRELRNRFPNIILDYHILQVLKEHKLNYFALPSQEIKNIEKV